MGIRRHTDDKRAAASTKPISPTARAKLGGVIERWKEQLAAGEDLTETSEPSIDDENGGRFPPRSRDGNPSYFDPRSAIALRNRDRACRKRRREPGGGISVNSIRATGDQWAYPLLREISDGAGAIHGQRRSLA
jgi:hypothetical protein